MNSVQHNLTNIALDLLMKIVRKPYVQAINILAVVHQ